MEQKITFHRFSNSGESYYSKTNIEIEKTIKLYRAWEEKCKETNIALLSLEDINKYLSNFNSYLRKVSERYSDQFTTELPKKIGTLEKFHTVAVERYNPDSYFDEYITEEEQEEIKAEFDFDDLYRYIFRLSYNENDIERRIKKDSLNIKIHHKFSLTEIQKYQEVFNNLKAEFLKKIFATVNEKYKIQTAKTYQNILNDVYKRKFMNEDVLEYDIEIFKKCLRGEEIIFHDRVEKADTDTINDAILKMNKEGWTAKQIQGIESGRSYYEIQKGEHEKGGSGAGAGYSFTEGIMILWEKN